MLSHAGALARQNSPDEPCGLSGQASYFLHRGALARQNSEVCAGTAGGSIILPRFLHPFHRLEKDEPCHR